MGREDSGEDGRGVSQKLESCLFAAGEESLEDRKEGLSLRLTNSRCNWRSEPEKRLRERERKW